MAERYRIIEPNAGEGGFGKVAKAADEELERQVAIKVLDPLFKDKPSEQDKERFRREARTLASLSYPTIPAIYDVRFSKDGEAEQEFKIIFEWIEGTTVRQWLMDKGPVSLEEARRWFTNICGALAHAHSKGVIHRDIKPSNLIVSPDGSCYLVDFGISLRKSDLDRLTNHTPIGTLGYMSPEQEKNEPTDLTTDLFSLGIVLYECLAGMRPSIGGYRSLNTFNETIPPAIDTLVKQCVGDKSGRPPSATVFLSMLNQALTPHVNFTETLSSGSLYEIEVAVGRMSPLDYSRVKLGQRIAVVSRLRDLVNVDDDKMRRPTAQLLASLAKAAHLDPNDDYRFIVEHCLVFGYEKKYDDAAWRVITGNHLAREALNEVAVECNVAAHAVISAQSLNFLRGRNLDGKPKWYFHDLRDLLQNLLINPQCSDENARLIGDQLTEVNRLSHKWADTVG